MTYREKLMLEHPGCENDSYSGWCEGCPCDYGYEPPRNRTSGVCVHPEMGCIECWNREMPENKDSEPEQHDPVDHPSHYTAGGIECIDAIAAALTCQTDPVQAWLTGQVIKYLWRWPLKNGVEDLRKAQWYLNRLIESADGEKE